MWKRFSLVAVPALAWGCASIAGLDNDYILDEESAASSEGSAAISSSSGGSVSSATSGGPGSGGSAGVGGGSGGVGGGAGQGGAGGSAGQGGAGPCGDGKIDPGEECDDKNVVSGDGCNACQVVCSEPDALEHPATHHCYWLTSSNEEWPSAEQECSALGSYLATITSQSELDFVKDIANDDAWLGALRNGGMWAWITGEPWSFVAWGPGEPEGADCLELWGNGQGLWGSQNCGNAQKALCEWSPPGAP